MPTAKCKLCESSHGQTFKTWARAGMNASEAQAKAEPWGISFTRQTWYGHVKHSKPREEQVQDKLEELQELGGLRVKKVSNTEYLESIRDISAAQITENPEMVKPELGLAAVKILESRKNNQVDQLNLLIGVITGNAIPPLIVSGGDDDAVEGEVLELPSGE